MRTRHKGWIKLNLVFEDEFQVPLLMLLLSMNAALVCTVLNKLMSSLSKRTWLLSKINRGLFHCTFNLNRPAQKISRLHIHTSEWKASTALVHTRGICICTCTYTNMYLYIHEASTALTWMQPPSAIHVHPLSLKLYWLKDILSQLHNKVTSSAFIHWFFSTTFTDLIEHKSKE